MKMNWRPLIEMPKNVPSASFVTDKAFVDEYKGIVESDFDDAKVLKVIGYSDGVAKGSNPFAVVLANSIASQQGYRVANQAELEKALSLNALPLQGQYEDTALVLRSESNPNQYLAQNLAEQVRKRGFNLNNPLVIPLSGLELVKDSTSEHGLAFKLTDKSQIIVAPILASQNGSYIDSYQMNKDTGLPTAVFPKPTSGNRQLLTRDSGLSRLYLDSNLNVNSCNGGLAISDDYGRVVLVSGEATGADFLREYQQKLEAKLQSRKSELDKWFANSMAQMPKGKN